MMEPPRVVSVDDIRVGGRRGPGLVEIGSGRVHEIPTAGDATPPRVVRHYPGTFLPGFCDAHVHLGLLDRPERLLDGGIARVVDLGWDPRVAASWLQPGAEIPETVIAGAVFPQTVIAGAAFPQMVIAGAILTAPGGYPSRSGWAPAAAVREIGTEEEAAAALDESLGLGAGVAKIALNTDVGPVWDDRLLARVVALAHDGGLPVFAHAQGAGQAARALAAGVDVLAHTPWSERLPDPLIAEMATRMEWISSLDIHARDGDAAALANALGNLERFAAAGGTVRYGTDLGNGPLPLGLNPRELRALRGAGLSADGLIESLAGPLSRADGATLGRRVSWIPEPQPGDSELVDWLLRAKVLDVADLSSVPDPQPKEQR